MKLTTEQDRSLREEEIIVRYPEMNGRLQTFIEQIDSFFLSLNVQLQGRLLNLKLESICYFESVEENTFVYTLDQVYECRQRLYELEQRFDKTSCVRVSKHCILNTLHVDSVRPMLGGRMEAVLENQEKIVINRHYLPGFKAKFGLEEAK